mgnify:CR=1 FL=1
MNTSLLSTLGNTALLSLHKTAFLCCRRVPAGAALRCYDWAIAQREAGECVVSGFHSPLEKDVLRYLLRGKQPVILALARGMKERVEPELHGAMKEGRLLMVTPFVASVKRVTEQTATERNRWMMEIAERIAAGYVAPSGQVETLLLQTSKPIEYVFAT